MPNSSTNPATYNDKFTTSIGISKIVAMLEERHGERYSLYRQAWENASRGILPDFPLNLIFDLIDSCNLKCPQCLRSPDLLDDYKGYIGTQGVLTLDDISRVLDECAEKGLASVNIGGGGECLLHPDFTTIVAKIMAIDPCELRIISNGLRLNRDVAECLIDQQAHMISVSIDAHSSETFEKVRGKASYYPQIVENVLNFVQLRKRRASAWPLLRVSFVKQPDNLYEEKDFVAFWQQHVDLIDVQAYHDFRSTNYSRNFECNEPFKRLTLWSHGGAGPCCGFPGVVYKVGDFRKQSLHEIWHGAPIREIRRQMLDADYQQPCLQCQGTRQIFDN